ncbi:DUF934 domain-containing protein [Sandaracinus amylolyticus]|uniref:Oxidoreductase probably in sulfite reduction n=1 Tax=Sandaracinus amylolyticus TaxID=927083 RepID=A0A0F6W4D4_9BACT|nr:DUF934 domain-containing protein [Sandaracinus amylolyticus]AKF07111.1 Oxidoreductase probably in sulfite reduction [Sandaracinus amylolyticus]
MRLVRDRRVVDDSFVHVGEEGEIPDGADVIVPWSRWTKERAQLGARRGRIGVRVPSDRKAEELASDVASFAVIAIEFPKFADGRGYSIARHLRDRYAYRGELRAVGNVLRDQIFYLSRCGFDTFEIDASKSAEDAIAGLDDFSVKYQTAADEKTPIWRRHARAWPAR